MESAENLKDLHAAFQLLTEGVEEYSIILLDEQGTILTWNKGVEKLKGYTAEEIIGQNISIFYLPEDRQTGLHEKLLAEARKTGHAVFYGRRIRKNGTIFWGKIELTAIKNKEGAVIGFTKMARELKDEATLGNFWFDPDGILHTKASPVLHTPEGLAQFRKMIQLSSGDQRLCCIADLRDAILTEIQVSFSRPDIVKAYKAVAFISNPQIDPNTEAVTSAISKEIPTKVFTSREDAKNWIKQYL